MPPQRKTKKKREDKTLKNVVSLRISDQEKRLLEKISSNGCRNVSEVIREAIGYWLARRRNLVLLPE